MYESDYERYDTGAWSAFVAGALIGAGLALIFAPQTGSELRGMLRSYANRAKDDLVERGREAWDTAVERGKDYVDTGRQSWDSAVERGKQYMETGRETMREAGRTVKETADRAQETAKQTARESMQR